MTDLTQEGKRHSWGQEHTDAWKELQCRLATQPVLRQPELDKHFYVDTDASNTGVGAVLIQRDGKGFPHPIAYASRKMNTSEKVYSTMDQEALAILFGIGRFDEYLRGRRFTVVTDHKSLSWLFKVPVLKGKLLNWAFKLRSYDFDIIYRKGTENAMADLLSAATW